MIIMFGHHTAEGNLEFIISNLILLQEHYDGANIECADCILKHLETIRAYAEESLGLDNAIKYKAAIDQVLTFAENHIKIITDCISDDNKCIIKTEEDKNVMISQARILRRELNVLIYGLAGDLIYKNDDEHTIASLTNSLPEQHEHI